MEAMPNTLDAHTVDAALLEAMPGTPDAEGSLDADPTIDAACYG